MKYFNVTNFPTNIVAFTTTKHLGNVAFQVGDNKEGVIASRKEISKDYAIPLNDFTFTHQFHSTIIEEVTSKNKGLGVNSFESGVRADALYTKDYNTPIGVFHADCVPIFVCVPSIPLVGIIHAGKKGSIDEITFKSLLTLIVNEHVDPRNILLHLGPSLSKEKEIISEEEKQYLIMHGYQECVEDDKLDKPLLNILQALRLGVLKENITQSDVDTFSSEDTFSFCNKDKEIGRHASIIYIKS